MNNTIQGVACIAHSLSYFPIAVCVCVCVVYACSSSGSPLTLCFEMGSPTGTQDLQIMLGSLAIEPQGITCLWCLSTGIRGAHHHTKLFMGLRG